MSKPVLFFANLCPDTAPFVAELARLEVDYESVEIMSSMANFKRFLTLRDQHLAFEQAKRMAISAFLRCYWQTSKWFLILTS